MQTNTNKQTSRHEKIYLTGLIGDEMKSRGLAEQGVKQDFQISVYLFIYFFFGCLFCFFSGEAVTL